MGERSTARARLVSLFLPAAYAGAVLLGRTTHPQHSQLALVWPAAAVGYLWLSRSWGDRRALARDALLMTLLSALVTTVTGASPLLALALAPATPVDALVACAVASSLVGDQGLRRPRDLIGLVLASTAGALVSALVGPAVLAVAEGAPLPATVATWVLRNSVSTFALAGSVLLLRDAGGWGRWRPLARGRTGHLELVAVTATVLAGYWLVFWGPTGHSLSYAVIPLSVWVGMRLTTPSAAGHVLFVGVVVLVSTWWGHGPFGHDGLALAVPLAQAFIGVVGFLTLVLALHRDERADLQDRLEDALDTAAEEAALLKAVLASTSDAIVVLDRTQTPVVRNAASRRVLGEPLGPGEDPFAAWSEHRLDGSPLPERDRPSTRALAGQDVPAFDTLLRHRTSGREVVISGSCHPLPRAETAWGGGAVLVYRDATAARAAAAELASSRDQLAGILGAATEQAIIGLDLTGAITFFNQGAERMTGHLAAEVLGTPAAALVDRGELLERAAELGVAAETGALLSTAATERHETRRWSLRRTDGERRQVQLTVTAIRDEDGAATGFMALGTDVTARVEAEARLADSENLFRLTFDLAPVGMSMVSLTPGSVGRLRRVNRHFAEFTGHTEAELLTLAGTDLLHPDEQVDHHAVLEHLAETSGEPVHRERRFLVPGGGVRWGSMSTAVVHPGDGGERYLLCLVEDINARKEAEAELTRLALHDALTGLPNRRLFADRLDQALVTQTRTGADLGLLYLDLDGFKEVNDTLGHSGGDALLVAVSQRVRACVRQGDTVARLGGDEFAILCPDLGAPADAEVVARRVLAALSRPVKLEGGTARVGVSIGLAVGRGDEDADQLVRAADAAMYRAKRSGKGCVEVHGRGGSSLPLPR